MGRRTRTILRAILAVLLIAGCAPRGDGAQDDRQGGFYGGVSGGRTFSGGPDM